MNLAGNLFYGSVAAFLLGALLALIFSGSFRLSTYAAYIVAFIGALLGLFSSLIIILKGITFQAVLFKMVLFGDFAVTIDSISAGFMLIISVSVIAVSIYSLGYTMEYKGKKNPGFLGAVFNIFLLSMYLVVTVNNAFSFLLVWEIMSVVSYFLVITDHEVAQVRKAGFIYLVMTHLGTVFIFVLFLLFYRQTGSMNFSAFKNAGPHFSSYLKNLIFLFTLIGFGTKAGLIPLHIWLPRAHPVAPSHVSALMSGVMIKTAIYGMIRIIFGFLGTGYAWWGTVFLVLGTISAVLGVIYALVEKDLKKLLAYSSVENMGIIIIGLGAALLLRSYGYADYSVLAFMAAFLHMLNHSLFKNLLFMGAGSVLYATGTKNIDSLGGLIKKMPWTAGFFLVGALSISAIPPFNGFISEWLTLQVLLILGISLPVTFLKVVALFAGASLAFTGALVASCFVKAFGLSFLAIPRSKQAEKAKEVPMTMRIGMGILAITCFIFGVLPVVPLKLISSISNSFFNLHPNSKIISYQWLPMAKLKTNLAGISPEILFIILIIFLPMTLLLVRLIGGRTSTRVDGTWTCGGTLNKNMEYTATSFSQPFQILFAKILRPRQQTEDKYEVAQYFKSQTKYHSVIRPTIEIYLYRPFLKLFLFLSSLVRKLQTGSVHTYLAYIFITLLVLLVLAK